MVDRSSIVSIFRKSQFAFQPTPVAALQRIIDVTLFIFRDHHRLDAIFAHENCHMSVAHETSDLTTREICRHRDDFPFSSRNRSKSSLHTFQAFWWSTTKARLNNVSHRLLFTTSKITIISCAFYNKLLFWLSPILV